jgi:hypothetical protein
MVCISCSAVSRKSGIKKTRAAEPHHFNAEPDPTFHLHEDPDPAFYFIADPDPHQKKMMGICTHWSIDPPRLHFDPPPLGA